MTSEDDRDFGERFELEESRRVVTPGAVDMARDVLDSRKRNRKRRAEIKDREPKHGPQGYGKVQSAEDEGGRGGGGGGGGN